MIHRDEQMPPLVAAEIPTAEQHVTVGGPSAPPHEQNAPVQSDVQINGAGQPNVIKPSKQVENKDQSDRENAPANATREVANGVCTEFSYRSLVMFNRAINELQNIEPMSDQAMVVYFQKLRDFVTRFLALCQKLRIDIRFLEAVLISHVIASFNEMVFSKWKFHMLNHFFLFNCLC